MSSYLLALLLTASLLVPARLSAAEERVCVPGQVVTLVGTAQARSGLLVRFGGRVVAGATSSIDGRYTIELQIGQEPAGRYPVVVELRDTRALVQSLTCVVPGAGDGALVAQALAPTQPPPSPAAPLPTVPQPAPQSAPAADTPAPAAPADAATPEEVPAGEVPASAAGSPTPTVRPSAQRLAQGQAPTGWAELTADTPLLLAVPPRGEGDVLAPYRAGTRVRLLGQAHLRWVLVQPVGAVANGWMDAALLRVQTGTPGPETPAAPVAGDGGTDIAADQFLAAPDATTTPTATAALTGTGVLTPTIMPTPAAATPAASGGSLALTVLPPSTPTPAPAAAPVARTVSLSVCRSRSATARTCAAPLPGVRVELLAATGETLARTTTSADGAATLAVSVPAGAALLVRLPALGVEARAPEGDAPLPVQIPPQLLLGGAP